MASPDRKKRLVEIGVVGKPHGVKGGLNIYLHNESTNLGNYLNKLQLQTASSTEAVTIEGISKTSKGFIAFVENVNTRDHAERFRGAKLLVTRDSFPDTESDEFYVDDLLGLEAFDGETQIGKVVSSTPQADIEVITVENDSSQVMVPLVEDFVERIDFDHNRIILRRVADLPSITITRRG